MTPESLNTEASFVRLPNNTRISGECSTRSICEACSFVVVVVLVFVSVFAFPVVLDFAVEEAFDLAVAVVVVAFFPVFTVAFGAEGVTFAFDTEGVTFAFGIDVVALAFDAEGVTFDFDADGVPFAFCALVITFADGVTFALAAVIFDALETLDFDGVVAASTVPTLCKLTTNAARIMTGNCFRFILLSLLGNS